MKERWIEGRTRYSTEARKLIRMMAKEDVTVRMMKPAAEGSEA